jgi:hypothetical protein
MAIKIQDNFQLNVALPIDNRIVASGSTARNNIAFKYDGLRVFDTSDRKSYVWNSSSLSWSDSDTAGTGVVSTLAKWGTTTGLTSSGVYFVSGSGLNVGKVGINTSDPKGSLHIEGDGGVAKFVFHSYSTGVVFGQNFWNNGSDQFFDFGNGSSVIRMNTSGHIDFLCRVTGAAALNSTGGDGNTNMMMKIDPSQNRTFLYTDLILSSTRTLPTTSALLLRRNSTFSTSTTPDVTWWNNDQTGIYHPGNNIIAFSISSTQMMRLTSTGLIVGNQTQTSNRILINNTTSVGTYLQATNASMGSGSTRGAFFGINTVGSAAISSREGTGDSTKPISFGFSGGLIHHKFEPSSLQIYNRIGSAATEAQSITGDVSRLITGFGSWTTSASGNFDAFIGSIRVPNTVSLLNLEVTYTVRMTVSGSSTQFKTQKIAYLAYWDATNWRFYNVGAVGNFATGTVTPTGPGTLNPGDAVGHKIYEISTTTNNNLLYGVIKVVNGAINKFEFYFRINGAPANTSIQASAFYQISVINP